MYYVNIVLTICFQISAKLYKQDPLEIPPRLYSSLFKRIFFGFLSDVLLYIAFIHINYSKALCIYFTNTLMIPIFGWCMLKEKIYKWDALGIIFGFVGMILIMKPYKNVEHHLD